MYVRLSHITKHTLREVSTVSFHRGQVFRWRRMDDDRSEEAVDASKVKQPEAARIEFV